MDPIISDRGSHLEVLIGAGALCEAGFVDLLVRARTRFGAKPVLVVCEDPAAHVRLEDAYRIGIDLSERLPRQRVAIALRGRKSAEAERFTELVAANRGAELRYFDDVPAAKAWLGVA
jgi:hypothetical protein